MRACSNCGSEIALSDVFCTNCGAGQAPSENQAGPEHGSASAAVDGFGDPATATVGTTLEVVTDRAEAPTGTPFAPETPPPGQAHGSAQPPFAGAPSGVFAPGAAAAPTRAGETVEQKYMRQTRNATVFIAVIVGIVTVIALVGVIWTATTISKLNSQLSGDNGVNSSNCESVGGTNPNC